MKPSGYIGLDVGTSGCKASVIDENGSMEKELLRNILVTVSHKIYIDLAFDLLRKGDK